MKWDERLKIKEEKTDYIQQKERNSRAVVLLSLSGTWTINET